MTVALPAMRGRALGSFVLFLNLTGCNSCSETDTSAALSSVEQPPARLADQPPSAPAPALSSRTLLELPQTAYGAKLLVNDDRVTLLTNTGVIETSPGLGEATRFEFELSHPFTPFGNGILYFQRGKLLQRDRTGEQVRVVTQLERQPYLLLASEDRFAWIQRRGEKFLVNTLRGDRVSTVYETDHYLVTGTMLQDWVFLVERRQDATWEIVGFPVSGGIPTHSKSHPGRPPSLLVAHESLYYYAGPQAGVRKLSPDLRTETAVHEDVICSPLAVSDRVVCAHVGGVFELFGPSDRPRIIAAEPDGPIAAIAASKRWAAWVVDSGKNALKLKVVPLAPAEASQSRNSTAPLSE